MASSMQDYSAELRVLIAIPTMGMGGAEKQAALAADALAQAGVRVEFIYGKGGPMVAYSSSIKVNHHCCGRSLNRFYFLILVLWKAVQKKPHVMFAWLYEAEVCGLFAKLLLGCPMVMTERSNSICYNTGLRWRVRELYAKFANMVVCNSESGAQYWRKTLASASSEKIVIVRNIINRKALIPSHKMPREKAAFLSVGRLTAVKDFSTLIKAWSAVAYNMPEATLSILGEGPLRKELERETSTLGLEKLVSFLGDVPGAEKLMHQFDCFISCSLFEGQPNAVLEAMANECPVILSDIPAHRECATLDSAVFFKVGDWRALAQHVMDFSSSRDAFTTRAMRALSAVDVYGSHETGLKTKCLLEDVARPESAAARIL